VRKDFRMKISKKNFRGTVEGGKLGDKLGPLPSGT